MRPYIAVHTLNGSDVCRFMVRTEILRARLTLLRSFQLQDKHAVLVKMYPATLLYEHVYSAVACIYTNTVQLHVFIYTNTVQLHVQYFYIYSAVACVYTYTVQLHVFIYTNTVQLHVFIQIQCSCMYIFIPIQCNV